MRFWRRRDQRGYTFVEVLIAIGLIGAVVLFGIFSLYRATINVFTDASSQASLQRVGALALQAITRQAQWAQSITVTAAPGCAPAGTQGRVLELIVDDSAVALSLGTMGASLPADQLGRYCYYAGSGANAGALCQSFSPGTGGVYGAAGPCWNLLAAAQPGLSGKTPAGSPAEVVLVRQTTPANPWCPRNADDGSAIATNVYCLALSQNIVPFSTLVTSDIAFAITDGVSSTSFTASLMLRN
jgi:prepilin-type N-terminal cleavage/methylation domain-containing protein